MPVYMYEANKDGRFIKGTLQAPSVQLASVKLKSRNLDPVYIVEKPAVAFFFRRAVLQTKGSSSFHKAAGFFAFRRCFHFKGFKYCFHHDRKSQF